MIDGLTNIQRKRKKLEMAVDEATGYKKKQLETKLYQFNRKHFPKIIWESGKKGMYRKAK